MSANDRITMVIINDDGTRKKFTLGSWVGVPRKHELVWIAKNPYVVIEVEYAVSSGFFGGSAIEAAGVYLRPLDEQERKTIAERLDVPIKGKDEQPFRP